MQIGTPPPRSSTVVPLPAPWNAHRGTPTTDSVLFTTRTPITPFPEAGIGLDGWIQLMRTSQQDAVEGAKYLSELKGRPMVVVQYRPKGWSQAVYGAGPLVRLDWVAGGYGGSFRSTPLTRIDASSLFEIAGKAGGARVVAVVDQDRVVPTTRVDLGVRP